MLNIIFVILYELIILFVNALFLPLPWRDAGLVRYRSFAWMTALLITVNVCLFLFWQPFTQMIVSDHPKAGMAFFIEHVWTYGSRRAFLYSGEGIGPIAAFTSMFMHIDLGHLMGNMIYLWAFGRRIEDACGPWRYLAFYLLAGLIADIAYTMILPASDMDFPGIGASGAIAGVMGAYLILFPGRRVTTLWFIPSLLIRPMIMAWARMTQREAYYQWRWTLDMPAIFLLVWFAFENILPSFQIIGGVGEMSGVNTLAHMAGFLASITIFFFVRRDLLRRYVTGKRL
ncbi:hypothetical protein MASR2M15_21440 [Anaerolineales bacterium]